MNALTDAITSINTLTNFFFNLIIFGNVKLGFLIMNLGLIGAAITMIANYKGQG